MSLEQPYGGRRREDPLRLAMALLRRMGGAVEHNDFKRAELEALNLSRAFRMLHERNYRCESARRWGT